MRRITHIVVHCTATPEGRKHTASDIAIWHKQRGWNTIGYHYVVQLDGTIEKGRDEAVVGAHVASFNSYTIGVVYVGGVDRVTLQPKDTRTSAQKAALLQLLKELKQRHAAAKIQGHRDFPGVAKACPCFDAKTEYAYL